MASHRPISELLEQLIPGLTIRQETDFNPLDTMYRVGDRSELVNGKSSFEIGSLPAHMEYDAVVEEINTLLSEVGGNYHLSTIVGRDYLREIDSNTLIFRNHSGPIDHDDLRLELEATLQHQQEQSNKMFPTSLPLNPPYSFLEKKEYDHGSFYRVTLLAPDPEYLPENFSALSEPQQQTAYSRAMQEEMTHAIRRANLFYDLKLDSVEVSDGTHRLAISEEDVKRHFATHAPDALPLPNGLLLERQTYMGGEEFYRIKVDGLPQRMKTHLISIAHELHGLEIYEFTPGRLGIEARKVEEHLNPAGIASAPPIMGIEGFDPNEDFGTIEGEDYKVTKKGKAIFVEYLSENGERQEIVFTPQAFQRFEDMRPNGPSIDAMYFTSDDMLVMHARFTEIGIDVRELGDKQHAM